MVFRRKKAICDAERRSSSRCPVLKEHGRALSFLHFLNERSLIARGSVLSRSEEQLSRQGTRELWTAFSLSRRMENREREKIVTRRLCLISVVSSGYLRSLFIPFLFLQWWNRSPALSALHAISISVSLGTRTRDNYRVYGSLFAVFVAVKNRSANGPLSRIQAETRHGKDLERYRARNAHTSRLLVRYSPYLRLN